MVSCLKDTAASRNPIKERTMKAAKVKSPPRVSEPAPEALSPVEALPRMMPVEPPPLCPPTEEEIRVLAYHKWVAAGCPPGDGVCFWLEAEKELAQNRKPCPSTPEPERLAAL
jgi:hypothetical protein